MNIDNIKYINFNNEAYYNSYLIAFFIEFGFDSGTYWGGASIGGFNCTCGYDCGFYYIIHEDNKTATKNLDRTWLKNMPVKYYSTYPENIYNPSFCGGGQTGGIDVPCSGSSQNWLYYNSTTEYFYPPNQNYFLNLDNRSIVTDCEVSNYGKCRLPDSEEKRSYCLFKPNDNNLLSCASSVSTSTYDNYNDNFKCKNGFTKIYFECIPDDTIKNSALYFSNVYSFNSLSVSTLR